MNQLAEDVWHRFRPPRAASSTPTSSATRRSTPARSIHGKKVVVRGRRARLWQTHVLTHVHNDHAGGNEHVKETLGGCRRGLRRDVGGAGAAARRSPRRSVPGGSRSPGAAGSPRGRARPRAPRGRRAGGTASSCSRRRATAPATCRSGASRTRTLICGDVFFGMNVVTTRDRIRQPIGIFTYDQAAEPPQRAASRRSRAEAGCCSGTGRRCAISRGRQRVRRRSARQTRRARVRALFAARRRAQVGDLLLELVRGAVLTSEMACADESFPPVD